MRSSKFYKKFAFLIDVSCSRITHRHRRIISGKLFEIFTCANRKYGIQLKLPERTSKVSPECRSPSGSRSYATLKAVERGDNADSLCLDLAKISIRSWGALNGRDANPIMMLDRAVCSAIRSRGLLLIILLSASGCSRQSQNPRLSSATVIFVCQHGAAKSVIAAAYFNQLAAQRNLNFHAIARGVTPQEDLSSATVAGLQKDGVPFSKEKPQALTPTDVRTAVRVVAFCPLPQSLSGARHLDSFDVLAPTDGYEASRNDIVAHVRKMIEQMSAERGNGMAEE